jgi:hypothetical protein
MRINRIDRVAGDQKLIAGVQKLLKGPIRIAGEMYTAKQAMAVLKTRVDVVLAAEAARGVWLGVLNKEKVHLAETKEFVAALRKILQGMYASDVATLHELGLGSRSSGKLDAEATLAKVEKMRATRKARHTLGRRQREEITGEIDTVTPTVGPRESPAPAVPGMNRDGPTPPTQMAISSSEQVDVDQLACVLSWTSAENGDRRACDKAGAPPPIDAGKD